VAFSRGRRFVLRNTPTKLCSGVGGGLGALVVLGWLGFWFLLYTRFRQAKRPSQCQMAEHTLRLPWVLRAGQCPDTGCLARRSAELVRYPEEAAPGPTTPFSSPLATQLQRDKDPLPFAP